MTALAILAGLFWAFGGELLAIEKLVWPTPSTAFQKGETYDKWVQPTGSWEPQSGLFGCVRSEGYQFHEGIDIAAVARDKRGIPTDPIYAVLNGTVSYVSNKPGYSNYGRYIIIAHQEEGLRYNSLYAHLASIDTKTAAGATVTSGQKIGIMGHSASNGLPLERAHLHLEFNVQLTNNFQTWYDAQKFGQRNRHGNHNGFNFISWDPLHFYESYRRGQVQSVAGYIRGLPTTVVAIVRTNQTPWFVRQNPALLSAPIPETGLTGWQVEFTEIGLPKLWTPLTDNLSRPLTLKDGASAQVACRKLKNGNTPGKSLKAILEMLFGRKF